jgi:hypothetical protein
MILELWLGFHELLWWWKEVEVHRSYIYREFGIKSLRTWSPIDHISKRNQIRKIVEDIQMGRISFGYGLT